MSAPARIATEDAERVRDRDPLEPEAAKQGVRRGLERRRPRTEAPIDREVDHHARRPDPHRVAKGLQILGPQHAVDERDIRRLRRRSESGKMLHARSLLRRQQPAEERQPEHWLSKLPAAEWPVGGVEDRRQVDVDARGAERLARRSARDERV
jgi:hypothetical protein